MEERWRANWGDENVHFGVCIDNTTICIAPGTKGDREKSDDFTQEAIRPLSKRLGIEWVWEEKD